MAHKFHFHSTHFHEEKSISIYLRKAILLFAWTWFIEKKYIHDLNVEDGLQDCLKQNWEDEYELEEDGS